MTERVGDAVFGPREERLGGWEGAETGAECRDCSRQVSKSPSCGLPVKLCC